MLTKTLIVENYQILQIFYLFQDMTVEKFSGSANYKQKPTV